MDFGLQRCLSQRARTNIIPPCIVPKTLGIHYLTRFMVGLDHWPRAPVPSDVGV